MDKEKIEWIIKKGEKELFEFKSYEKLGNIKDSGKKELAKLFVALANNKGGTVFFGVTDEGNIETRFVSNKEFEVFRQTLVNVADKRCNPSIHLENVERSEFGAGHVLTLNVPKRKRVPHTVDGKFYKRVDSQNLPVPDPIKIQELWGEKEDKIIEKQDKVTEIELEEVYVPSLKIDGYKKPYIKIKTDGRTTCGIFGKSNGYSDGFHYFYSETLYGITPEMLEDVFKVFFSTFGVEEYYRNPSFLIKQGHYSWFGYGPQNFITALKEQRSRYDEAQIKNPHHREIAGFIADRDDYIFYIGLQPNVSRTGPSDYVNIGFVLNSIPLVTKKFISFYDKLDLVTPNYIDFDNDYLKTKYLSFHKTPIKLEKMRLIIDNTPLGDENLVNRALCKNPFHGDRKVNPHLSFHEDIIVNLSPYHLIDEEVEYYLTDFRSIPIPYPNFDFPILNFRASVLETN